MSPNTRKRKSLISRRITDTVTEQGLSMEDQVEVLTLTMKQLGIYDQFNFQRKPTKAGRRLTPFDTRKCVWDFWHENSVPSTNTTSLAKLRHTDKSHVQTGLEFMSSVSIVRQRNRLFYQSICKTVQNTYKELYIKYLNSNEEHRVSWGTFLALKPFYIKPNTLKEIEMCCCKLHLHARWAINALIQNCKLQKIDLGNISDYQSFFSFLNSDCPEDEHAYIAWECFSFVNKKKLLCDDIMKKWQELKLTMETSNPNITVPMMMFQKELYKTRKGVEKERLKAIKKSVDLSFISDFIEKLLFKIVYHRNILKHYRNTIQSVKTDINAIYLDVDFAENLTVPVKFEPQSLHWSKEQVTVHSGILKYNGHKSYHPYFSDTRVHDQVFVRLTVDEMISEVPNLNSYEAVIVESDNCSSQYKSARHFSDMQDLSNRLDKKVIRIYGIAGHGKGEVCNDC